MKLNETDIVWTSRRTSQAQKIDPHLTYLTCASPPQAHGGYGGETHTRGSDRSVGGETGGATGGETAGRGRGDHPAKLPLPRHSSLGLAIYGRLCPRAEDL
jgi:hypothetical protein